MFKIHRRLYAEGVKHICMAQNDVVAGYCDDPYGLSNPIKEINIVFCEVLK